MDYLEFSKKDCEQMIKVYKIALRQYWGIITLNLAVLCVESYAIYKEPSHIFPAICIGIVICNFLWLFTCHSTTKMDLRSEKERINRIKDIEQTDLYKKSIELAKQSEELNKNFLNFAYHGNKQQESASPVVEK